MSTKVQNLRKCCEGNFKQTGVSISPILTRKTINYSISTCIDRKFLELCKSDNSNNVVCWLRSDWSRDWFFPTINWRPQRSQQEVILAIPPTSYSTFRRWLIFLHLKHSLYFQEHYANGGCLVEVIRRKPTNQQVETHNSNAQHT